MQYAPKFPELRQTAQEPQAAELELAHAAFTLGRQPLTVVNADADDRSEGSKPEPAESRTEPDGQGAETAETTKEGDGPESIEERKAETRPAQGPGGLDYGPDPEDGPYYNARGSGEVAPGFRKRLAIALTWAAVAAAGLFGLHKASERSNDDAPKGGAVVKKEDAQDGGAPKQQQAGVPAELRNEQAPSTATRSGNLLQSVDETLAMVKRGAFQPLVREIENPMSGNFTYQFMLKAPTDPSTASSGPETRLLKGVVSGPERDRLLAGLVEANMRVEAEVRPPEVTIAAPPKQPEQGSYAGLLFSGLSLAMMGGLLYIFYRSYRAQRDMMNGGGSGGGGGLGSLTRHQGDFIVDRPFERFSSVGGCPEVVEEMKELKDDLQKVMAGNEKIKLPRGIVLSGGPGTGKTLLARSLAGETDCPFLQIDSSQSTTAILVGTGQMRVKSAFDTARAARNQHTKLLRSKPGATGKEEGVCVLFFDEFDSIGSKRQSLDLGSSSDSERKNVVNALLNELDGIDATRNKNIIVMAATNFRDDLDPALMRPGRFTKKIDIPLPSSFEQRLDIMEKLADHIVIKKGKSFEDKESMSYIARITPGKSGDDLRAILEEATNIGRREDRDVITNQDMFEAYQRHLFGRPKPNLIKPEKHELVIRHELGHALCALACDIDVFLLSAVPRGNSAGRVVIDPEGIPEMLATKKDMLGAILLTAGGRAAEQACYGKLGITSGADGDLEQIRSMVARMVSSGLFEGMYSHKIFNHPSSAWKESHTKLVDSITEQALNVAEAIVNEVGPDTMADLTNRCRKLDRELVGPEAQAFFEDNLGGPLIGRIKMVAQRFFENPIGSFKPAEPAATQSEEPRAEA